MSYTRPCNTCGERISLREMPHGQWVAFDVSTEEAHVCGVKNEPDVSVKLKGRKATANRDAPDATVSRGLSNVFVSFFWILVGEVTSFDPARST